VVSKYLSADSIVSDIEKDMPDVYLIDYRLPGKERN